MRLNGISADKLPKPADCHLGAQAVLGKLKLGYEAAADPIPSKWNPNTHQWDRPSDPQGEFAYGFVITKGKVPVRSYVLVGSHTLLVDFVVHVQGKV